MRRPNEIIQMSLRDMKDVTVYALAAGSGFALLAAPAARARETGPVAEPPLDIGTRLELMVDDYLLHSVNNLSFHLHSPNDAEGTLMYDQPWEVRECHYARTFRDGDIYRMYYSATPFGTGSDDQYTCYAESTDGIHWTKPSLGLVAFNGSKDNNIIWKGRIAHNLSPFKDTNPNVRPSELYKAVGHHRKHYVLASPDGIHWRLMKEEPIDIVYGTHVRRGNILPDVDRTPASLAGTDGGRNVSFYVAFDTMPIVFWDAPRREYVLYSRANTTAPRDIWYSTSKDFLNWAEPGLVVHDVAPSANDQLYSSAIERYGRAPHLFVGFPMRLAWRKARSPDAIKSGIGEAVFICSRDGRSFHRYMEPLIRPGRDRRNWSKHSNMIAAGLLRTGEDEISVYYTRHNYSQVHWLQRAVFRIDGFVSLRAPYEGGEFTTKPLVFSGSVLVMNAATGVSGGVRVEVQDGRGDPLEGYRLEDCVEFYGDEIEEVVRWKAGADLGALTGHPVRLRFVMREADLYSLRFR